MFDTDSESESSPEVFARNPSKVCMGILNYKKQQHFKIYEAATKSLFADTKDRYDMDVIGALNLLQKINDRCADLGLRILNIPKNKGELKRLIAGHDSVSGANICYNHGTLKRELIKAYVKTFVNLPCQEAQEDDMPCMMLQNSLTEKAYQTVTRDPSTYMVGGEKSGLLLLKTILEQSAIDSSIDPDVIRKELAHAYLKFKELKYDVRTFHDWVQQKLNALRQTGHMSMDVATHLLTAYKSSNNDKLQLYIDRLEDIARESGEYLEVKSLMNNVKMKFDALKTSCKLEAVAKQEDKIVVLKAQIKELKKKGTTTGGNSSSGSGGGKS
jgi:regulator of sigma D